MKTITRSSLILTLLLTFLSPGCKKAEAPAPDGAQLLQQAFESATPALKQSVEAVATNLKAKNYVEVTKALEPIAMSPGLTESQQQAIMATIRQISDAVAANPKLDSPEMPALRAKIYSSLRRGTR